MKKSLNFFLFPKYISHISFLVISVLAFLVNQIGQLLNVPELLIHISAYIAAFTGFPAIFLCTFMLGDLQNIRRCNRCKQRNNCPDYGAPIYALNLCGLFRPEGK